MSSEESKEFEKLKELNYKVFEDYLKVQFPYLYENLAKEAYSRYIEELVKHPNFPLGALLSAASLYGRRAIERIDEELAEIRSGKK